MDPTTLESLIVCEIRKANQISRRDLAEKLEVSRSTAGRRVDSLIERGLMQESGVEEKSNAGRPKRFLELCGDYGQFAGFDFDAGHLYAVVTDFSHRKLTTRTHRFSSQPDRPEVISAIQDLINEISNAYPGILGYGIGVPGRISVDKCLALSYPYINHWQNVDLGKELDLNTNPLHIENNSKVIALSEYWLGDHSGCENLVCLNIRTGISAAVISAGQLLQGQSGMAGEIRGWRVGNRWLEDVATAKSALSEGDFTDWQSFVNGCRSNHPTATDVLNQVIQTHADTISRIVQLSDPEIVFVAGSFNELETIYLDRLKKELSTNLDSHYFTPPDIRFVTYGKFSGAMGAAALAAKHYLPTK